MLSHVELPSAAYLLLTSELLVHLETRLTSTVYGAVFCFDTSIKTESYLPIRAACGLLCVSCVIHFGCRNTTNVAHELTFSLTTGVFLSVVSVLEALCVPPRQQTRTPGDPEQALSQHQHAALPETNIWWPDSAAVLLPLLFPRSFKKCHHFVFSSSQATPCVRLAFLTFSSASHRAHILYILYGLAQNYSKISSVRL